MKHYATSDLHQYYYNEVYTNKEIPIASFTPSSVPTFYDVILPSGETIQLHYQRIKVKETLNENNKEQSKA